MIAENEAEDSEVDTHGAYTRAKSFYESQLEDHLERNDINGAHILWNKLAEICTLTVQGKTSEEAYA